MNSNPSHTLLKGGTLLLHEEHGRVIPRKADLLIRDDRIARIDDDIQPPAASKVIDCAGNLISPGFIDTHRHLWQTQQKGLHCDQILLDYYHSGNLASSHYGPNDAFCGVLGSCMEAIDAGTTTVVDHAHVNYSFHHSKAGLSILPSYITKKQFVGKSPPELEMDKFKKLAKEQPFGPNGRVRLGFAMDTMFVQAKVLRDAFIEAREHGAQLLTSHLTKVSMMDNMPSAVTTLHDNGLLGSDTLLSHANNITKEELLWIEVAGAHLSSTPMSELQMGHGHPICLEADFLPLSSIGTDSNSINTSSIPVQANTALQITRARQMAKNITDGTWDGSIGPRAEDAFNLGTVLGARAIGLGDEIGSLTVGKKADIVIFQGQSPTMVLASDRDPVAAIILHSSVRDVQTVIVDGIIRKENGSLCPIVVPTDITQHAETSSSRNEVLEWKDVANLLSDSRLRLEAVKSEIYEEDAARNGLIRSFLEAMAGNLS
ncbi:amidohydrolase family protein [Talaromyces pinophilus]|uniref:Amidohydrolase family protein n=1 Tax=Talaromyces pinophilus TaxID=128442 RepID=A0A0B8N460_TALPI|nr:amidohydrolase family protein [Talaromyces pinophilus]